MADLVRNIMEAMIPDLISLVKRKIFTRKEAKEILKAREQAEYTFLRKTSSKKDYLKAIQYEYDLERKRREQFKTLNLKKQKQQDYSIIRRIIYLFDRLTAKYKHNIEIWKEYCLFCYKIKSNRMFFKAISNALSMNWESLDIWLLAAYYQFEMNNNPFKARKMFLKALKINSDKREFWLEYFRFELKFLQKIKERQNIIGTEIQEEQANHDSDKESVGSYIEEEKNNEKHHEEQIYQIQSEKSTKNKNSMDEEFISLEESNTKKGLRSDQNDSLALVVYESMMESFPEDKSITSDALQICNEFQGEWIEDIKKNIFKVSKKEFHLNSAANLRTVLELESINRSAFENESTSTILPRFKQAIKSITKYLEELRNDLSSDLQKFSDEKINLILDLHGILKEHHDYLLQLKKDESKGFLLIYSAIIKSLIQNDLNSNRFLRMIDGMNANIVKLLLDLSELCLKTNEIPAEVKGLINSQYNLDKTDHKLLQTVARLTLFSQIEVIPKKELVSNIKTCLKMKKMDIPHESQAKLHYYLFELQNLAEENTEVICGFLKESIRYLAFTKSFSYFVQEILQKLVTKRGIQDPAVIEVFKILFNLKSGCPIEVSLMYVRELAKIQPNDKNIKQHLLKAVDWHPNVQELWLELIKWEKDFGDPLECANIFVKAQRHIKDDSFFNKYANVMQE